MAEAVGENIPRVFDLIIASPYLRCVQTAAEIARVHRLPILFDTELGEIFDEYYMPKADGKEQVRSAEWLTAYMKKSYADVEVITADGSRGSEVNIFGKHPEWPENVDMAKIRYLQRFEDICKIAQGASVLFVFHADGVVALMQVIGNVQVEKCNYCGWFFAEREVEAGVNVHPYSSDWKCQVGDYIDLSPASDEGKDDDGKLLLEIKKMTKAYRKLMKPEIWKFPSWISPREESGKPITGFWKDEALQRRDSGTPRASMLDVGSPASGDDEDDDDGAGLLKVEEAGKKGPKFRSTVARKIGGEERRSHTPREQSQAEG
jgi:broad specificity phosphatase PhoE